MTTAGLSRVRRELLECLLSRTDLGIPAIGNADQPLDVLQRRPDIIAAERRLAASNERIGVAISEYLPQDLAFRRVRFQQHRRRHFFLTRGRSSPWVWVRCDGGAYAEALAGTGRPP